MGRDVVENSKIVCNGSQNFHIFQLEHSPQPSKSVSGQPALNADGRHFIRKVSVRSLSKTDLYKRCPYDESSNMTNETFFSA